MLRRLQGLIAAALIASRWLMAPFYIGLIVALVVVAIAFFVELVHTIGGLSFLDVDAVIVATLKLMDLVLIANLVLIIISAGVGTLRVLAPGDESPEWTQFVGKIDFSALKLKAIASLTAIAAIDLLESFINIDAANKTSVMWQIAIMLAFVVAGVLLALMDRLAEEPHE